MSATLYIPIKQSMHLWGEVRAACQVSALPRSLRKVSEATSGGGRSKSQNSSLKLLGKRKGRFLHTRASKPTKTHPGSWLSQKLITYPSARGEEFFRRPALLHSTCLSFYRSLKGQLRGCEASSNYSKPYPEPCPLTPMANLIWITPLRPNPTHGLPEHTSFRPQKTQ